MLTAMYRQTDVRLSSNRPSVAAIAAAINISNFNPILSLERESQGARETESQRERAREPESHHHHDATSAFTMVVRRQPMDQIKTDASMINDECLASKMTAWHVKK